MKQSDWSQRFFKTTRGQVIRLLSEGESTVDALAERLGVTENAVRAHLASLERDGLVAQSGKRPGVRKPNFAYDLTAAGHQFFPKAYALLLNKMVTVLRNQLGDEQLETVLRTVGQQLASEHLPGFEHLQPAERVQRLVAMLQDAAMIARLDDAGEHVIVRGCSCPLADLVSDNASLCRIAAEVLSNVLGRQVTECCDRAGQPRCSFMIAKS